MSNFTVVPAGTYYLGDPCYVFEDHDDWMQLLESADYFNSECIGTIHGYSVYAFGTKWGDGAYPCTLGSEKVGILPVDAGLIGLVPIELVTKNGTLDEVLNNTGWGQLGIIVTFETDVRIGNDDGYMQFGKYHVDTFGGDDYEEEDNVY